MLGLCCVLLTFGFVRADDEVDVDGTVEEDLGKSREGSRTDDEVVQREEEANHQKTKETNQKCGIELNRDWQQKTLKGL